VLVYTLLLEITNGNSIARASGVHRNFFCKWVIRPWNNVWFYVLSVEITCFCFFLSFYIILHICQCFDLVSYGCYISAARFITGYILLLVCYCKYFKLINFWLVEFRFLHRQAETPTCRTLKHVLTDAAKTKSAAITSAQVTSLSCSREDCLSHRVPPDSIASPITCLPLTWSRWTY